MRRENKYTSENQRFNSILAVELYTIAKMQVRVIESLVALSGINIRKLPPPPPPPPYVLFQFRAIPNYCHYPVCV